MKNRQNAGVSRILASRSLAALLPFLFVGLLTGCGVGFQSHSLKGKHIEQPPRDLGSVSIAYTSDQGECLRELRLPFEKTLRQRHGIHKIQPLAIEGQKEPKAYLLTISCERPQPPSEIPLVISIFTFSAIPGTWTSETNFSFKLIAPNGDEKVLRYSAKERSYVWLPFIFFGARYSITIFGGADEDYQRERLSVLARMTERLMDDATPFLLAHSEPR